MIDNQQKALRVGIVGGTLGCIHNSFTMSTEKVFMDAAGNNTGNLAFRYAITNHIASEKIHIPWSSDPSWVREVCDLLVLPSSNQVNPGVDLANRANFVEAVDLPCLVLGLGAQAPSLKSQVKLQEGTIRYLKSIAERSHRIGVRGEYTIDILARLGIENTVVIGCPSNFINPLPTLGEVIEKKFHSVEPQRLVVTAGEIAASLKHVERKLIGWMRKYNGVYVCQAPQYFVSLARNREDEVSQEQLTKLHEYLQHRALRYLQPRSKFVNFLKQHLRVFFQADAWLEFLSTFDLSIGTRLHGNSLAIQSSIPAICIYHDSRTKELCGTLGIPHMSTNQFLAVRNISEAIELVSFDGKVFDRNRAKLLHEYKNLFLKSGIAISDRLESLARSGAVQISV
ncbi:polysaccharide pyruvyl transferase family protein [Candidatus Gracilibacteria bacterium]|jgi:Polysaccharide pyruvyl transferase|nr:polysaccharide pyruvyl transferase family protein [Candidatus Gracilibacteria bacterium]NJM86809.1 polysaccharide pyruvyl transferase family protein [Hydrococcus sp. RU_2_2]NJP17758.1 polysaccharide pyruvyl transferase family protein [Hydrococcus sp. CRU_1_1]